MMAVSIDDPLLGQLTEQLERVATGNIELRGGGHRGESHLLQDVFRFQLAPQRRTEIAVDVGQHLQPLRFDEGGQFIETRKTW